MNITIAGSFDATIQECLCALNNDQPGLVAVQNQDAGGADLTAPAPAPEDSQPKKKFKKFDIRRYSTQPFVAPDAAPPPSQQSGTTADPQQRTRNRNYAKEEEQRSFQDRWLIDFDWLQVPESRKFMICNPCSVVLKRLVCFTRFKRDTLTKHNKCPMHATCVAEYSGGDFNIEAAGKTRSILQRMEAEQQQQPAVDAAYDVNYQKHYEAKFDNKLPQLKIVHEILKHHRPMTDFEWQQDLISTFPGMEERFPVQHRSDTAGWGIAEALGDAAANMSRSRIESATAISFSVDASASINMVDNFNIEARLYHDGKLWLDFIRMEGIGQDTSAAGQERVFYKGLIKFLIGPFENDETARVEEAKQRFEQEFERKKERVIEFLQQKLVAVAADGCSTMQGVRGGLLTKLAENMPHIMKIWCTAHKVNLIAQILDVLAWFKDISEAVRGVATYFHRSCKRWDRLKEKLELLELPILKPLTVNDTRWLPIYGASKNLLKILPAVLLVLREDRAEFVVNSLYNQLLSAPVLLGMVAVEPILKPLEELSLIAQRHNLYAGDVAEATERCKRVIDLKLNDLSDEGLAKEIPDLINLINFRKVGGLQLVPDANGEVFFKAGSTLMALKGLPNIPDGVPPQQAPPVRLRQVLIQVLRHVSEAAKQVKDAIDDRFPTTSLMDAICMITPRYHLQLKELYVEDPSQLVWHCRNDLNEIIKQFGEPMMDGNGNTVAPLIDRKLLISQHTDFCAYMIAQSERRKAILLRQNVSQGELMMKLGGDVVENFWAGPSIPESISEYKKLAHIILSIPFGSVENERRFSAMNLVCTKLRNCMETEHLNTCLQVAAAPFTHRDFPFFDAFLIWYGVKNRRGVLRKG